MDRFLMPLAIFSLAVSIAFVGLMRPAEATAPTAACVRIAGSTEHYTEEGVQKLLSSGRENIIVVHKLMLCGW